MADLKHKTLVFWSSGKDSAYMLHLLKQDPTIEVVGLLTTIRESDHKINIHETLESDLDLQAKKLEIPLIKVFLPPTCPNTVYLERIHTALSRLKTQGLTHLAFGDLFLKDIRKFREDNFEKQYKLIFPLWGIDTRNLSSRIIQSGIKARIVAVDESKLSSHLIGHEYDTAFIQNLPKNVDPCGENGEFHTFVYDSPDFYPAHE